MSKIKVIIIFSTIWLCSCTTPNTDKIEPDQDIYNIDIDSFIDIDEIEIDTEFVKLNEIQGNELSAYSISGNYDFDCDGKADLVNFHIKFRDSILKKSELQINDSSIEYEFYNPFKIYVIDLDTEDEFVEFTIYDDGPSGDPSFTFFRYTGKEILFLGKINGYPKFDGNGQMITSSVNFLSPVIILEMAEIIDENIIFTVIDYTNYLNKKYNVSHDFCAYFNEMKTIPKGYIPSFDINETLIPKDSTIKIKQIELIGNTPYWYEVELDNKINGILYFWLGD